MRDVPCSSNQIFRFYTCNLDDDTTAFLENIISYFRLKINYISAHKVNGLIPFAQSATSLGIVHIIAKHIICTNGATSFICVRLALE